MITNEDVQSALIAYLKSKSSITNELVDIDGVSLGAEEIREDQWQGNSFGYPNIRVRMISNIPIGDSDQCDASNIAVSIMAFSEMASSKTAERISGIIGASLHAKSFEQSGLSITLRTTNLIPAVKTDRNTWRAECLMSGVVTKM